MVNPIDEKRLIRRDDDSSSKISSIDLTKLKNYVPKNQLHPPIPKQPRSKSTHTSHSLSSSEQGSYSSIASQIENKLKDYVKNDQLKGLVNQIVREKLQENAMH